jgi:hypothetical protein
VLAGVLCALADFLNGFHMRLALKRAINPNPGGFSLGVFVKGVQ